MNLPTLTESKDFVIKCIESCSNIQQLAICREMTETFIKNRYQYYENAIAMSMVLNEIDKAIENQRATMVDRKYSENNLITTTI